MSSRTATSVTILALLTMSPDKNQLSLQLVEMRVISGVKVTHLFTCNGSRERLGIEFEMAWACFKKG